MTFFINLKPYTNDIFIIRLAVLHNMYFPEIIDGITWGFQGGYWI